MTKSLLDARLTVRIVIAAFLSLGAFSLSSCGALGDGAFDGPTITSMTVQPSTIPKTDTTMQDQFFSIQLTVSGFEADIDDATAFIQEIDGSPQRPHPTTADEYSFSVSGTQIQIGGVPQFWFDGAQAGTTYNLGATVVDVEGSEVTQRNLAEVTVSN